MKKRKKKKKIQKKKFKKKSGPTQPGPAPTWPNPPDLARPQPTFQRPFSFAKNLLLPELLYKYFAQKQR